jgi:hypothetical protein
MLELIFGMPFFVPLELVSLKIIIFGSQKKVPNYGSQNRNDPYR